MKNCEIENCDKKHYSRGWCNYHYQNWYRKGDPNAYVKPMYRAPDDGLCSLSECDRTFGGTYEGIGYCSMHYTRAHRHGDPHTKLTMYGEQGEECLREGCSRKPNSRGYCRGHYSTWNHHNNIQSKIAATMRGRVRKSLKGRPKLNKTLELLGCTLDFYEDYIEDQWEEGMTWDNWSVDGWHIDHIVPIYKFDMTNDWHVQMAFNYTNTQPMWAKENLSKGRECQNEVERDEGKVSDLRTSAA